MTDQYEHWRDALAGKPVEIHDGHPQSGFYKLRRGKGSPWLPVAIFERDGALVCRVGNERADPLDIWTFAAKNPVSQADAKHAFEHGTWPGDVPDLPSAGHNEPPQSIDAMIRDVCEQAIGWLKKSGIKDSETSNTAANYRQQLLDLRKKADAARVEEKRPHDEAGRAVQAKWKPVLDEADSAANTLRDALTKWMRAEEARQRKEAEEAARKAREEAERERQRLLEEAKAQGVPEEEAAAAVEEDVPLPLPEPIAPKIQAGGQRGRKTGLRTVTRAEITDYAKALEFFADHEKVKALVQQLADHAARDGHPVPGVEVKKEKVAA